MYLFQKYSAVLVLTGYQILGTTGSVQSQKKNRKKVGLLSEEGTDQQYIIKDPEVGRRAFLALLKNSLPPRQLTQYPAGPPAV